MNSDKTKRKLKEWLKRYLPAELLGTLVALSFASIAYARSHSYILAAAAGFVGEGVGFYGYVITREILVNNQAYKHLPMANRFRAIIAKSSAGLIIEFAPAEIADNLFIRPFLMYLAPQHIKPYALGFVIGELVADVVFYVFAILGYEYRKRKFT